MRQPPRLWSDPLLAHHAATVRVCSPPCAFLRHPRAQLGQRGFRIALRRSQASP
jgi:hypothetical protein